MSPEMRFAAYRAVALDWAAKRITSTQLSNVLLINATQVRRDLSTLGQNGTRGVGYRPARLVEILDRRLDGCMADVIDEAEHQRFVANLVLVGRAD